MKYSVETLNGDQLQSFIEWVKERSEERKIEITIEGKYYPGIKITTRAWDGNEMASQYGFNHADEIDIAKAKKEQKLEDYKKLKAELGED